MFLIDWFVWSLVLYRILILLDRTKHFVLIKSIDQMLSIIVGHIFNSNILNKLNLFLNLCG